MTHPKNNEYVKRWRQMHRERYLEQDRRSSNKYYHFRKQVKLLLNIDPSFFI